MQPFSLKHVLRCPFNLAQFQTWTQGELHEVLYKSSRRRPGKLRAEVNWIPYLVPAPYDRIISQLLCKANHAKRHSSHESLRRGEYALKVLDVFATEHLAFQSTGLAPASFRSKTLTPILQRHRLGIHDAYAPFVRAGISSEAEPLTIEDVTDFYLGVDPTDPEFIPSYRRNLLYLPDSRWHLGLTLGVVPKKDKGAAISHYNRVRDNHDAIMKSLQAEDKTEPITDGIDLLSHAEVAAIIDEGLEGFFRSELDQVVSIPLPYLSQPPPHLVRQPDKLAKVKEERRLLLSGDPPPSSGKTPSPSERGPSPSERGSSPDNLPSNEDSSHSEGPPSTTS